MGKKLVVVAALLLGWWTPVRALAQQGAPPAVRESTAQDREAAPEVEDEWEDDVSGHLAPVPQGRVEQGKVEAAPFDYTWDDDGWGIRENRLHVVPRGVTQPDVGEEVHLLGRETSPWPGKHLQKAFDFADAYSYPELYPSVSAQMDTWVGGAGGKDNAAVFAQRAVLEMYVVRLGLDFVSGAPGTPWTERLSLDGRIPISLGDRLQLSLLPGIAYDLNVRGTSSNTSQRFQGILGYGGPGGFSAQVVLGAVRGWRPPGILSPLARVSTTQGIVGGLLAYRLGRVVEVRAEARSEIGEGADLLDLLPGLSFYPWHDERLELGLSAIVEDRSVGFKFKDPAVGGLLHLALNVI